ncbi:Pas55 [Cyanobium sp. PCC 7001]|nr:Pas55 [Cyanobium sp. PCC 7001]
MNHSAPQSTPLSPEHFDHLLNELGSEEAVNVAIGYGARSISADEANHLGFRFKGWRGGGLLLPFCEAFAQLRCDDPPTTYRGDQIKYLSQLGAKQHAATFGQGEPTIATEGWKDALRLHLATEQTVQAIAGVTAWKLLAPSVQLLIYDADAVNNPSVWGQLVAAGLNRPRLRLAFFHRDLAGPKGGACEFFRAGGDLANVYRWKARELLRELPKRWDRNLRADWHAPSIRRLASQSLQAGFGGDAAAQLVEAGAKRIRFSISRAREILCGERSKRTTAAADGGRGILRTDAPPERQAAEVLYAEHDQLIAWDGGCFRRYDHALGYWRAWSLDEARTAALGVLSLLCEPPKDPTKGAPRFRFGTDRQVQGAVSLLAGLAGRGPLQDVPPPVVVFGNGTFNLRTRRLEPHSPEHGATYAVDADYLPGAGCPAALQRVIETCYPEGAEPIIRAELRWLIDPSVRYGEVFHHLGDTGTGKGLLVEFLSSLLPPSLQATAAHPASLDTPEKLHQIVRGRRLLQFPDCPARLRNSGHSGLFYELVENKPQTARRLYSAEAEEARPFNVRCIIASVAPLQFSDGRDGFLRRCLTLQTLQRSGDPDPMLRSDLIGSTPEHRVIRSQAVSWAMSMPTFELEAILSKNDPEGLLRLGEAEAAAAGDSVSQFADACLVPHPLGPDAEVDEADLGQMFEAYRGWCKYAGVEHAMQLSNFRGQLRRVLGPGRCLPRRKESREEAKAQGRPPSQRQNLPRFDAGFALRHGLLRPSNGSGGLGNRETFDRMEVRSGGLGTLSSLRTALRPPALRPASDPLSPPHRADPGIATGPAGEAESPETTLPVSGRTQGVDSGVVSGQSPRNESQVGTGFSANQEGWSQGCPLYPEQGEKRVEEGGKKGEDVHAFCGEKKVNAIALRPPLGVPAAPPPAPAPPVPVDPDHGLADPTAQGRTTSSKADPVASVHPPPGTPIPRSNPIPEAVTAFPPSLRSVLSCYLVSTTVPGDGSSRCISVADFWEVFIRWLTEHHSGVEVPTAEALSIELGGRLAVGRFTDEQGVHRWDRLPRPGGGSAPAPVPAPEPPSKVQVISDPWASLEPDAAVHQSVPVDVEADPPPKARASSGMGATRAKAAPYPSEDELGPLPAGPLVDPSGGEGPMVLDLETCSATQLWAPAVPGRPFIRLVGTEAGIDTDPSSLVPWLASGGRLIAHNGFGFDYLALARHHGLDLLQAAEEGKLIDTMVLALALDPPKPPVDGKLSGGQIARLYSLDRCAERAGVPGKTNDLKKLARDAAKAHGHTGKPKQLEAIGYGLIPRNHPDYLAYLQGDVAACRAVYDALVPDGQLSPYARREMRVMGRLVTGITLHGTRLDLQLTQSRYDAIEARKEECRSRLVADYGLPTMTSSGAAAANPLSCKGAAEAITKAAADVGLVLPLTATGKPSTSKDALGPLLEQVREQGNQTQTELLETILSLTGARSVYGTALDHCQSDGRIHPQVAPLQASGRFSLTNPGITVFGKRGGRVTERAIFLPDADDHRLLAADLSQIDMRAMAAHAQDPAYLELFQPGRDAHSEIAAAVGLSRSDAKAIGHGWNYGMSVNGMVRHGISQALAEQFDQGMRRSFPQLVAWRDQIRERAASGQLLDNGFGRMMRPNPARAHTQGPALMGQGTARDLMMLALLRLPLWLVPQLRFLVHDELVFSVPVARLDEAGEQILQAMTFDWAPPGAALCVGVAGELSQPGSSWAECYGRNSIDPRPTGRLLPAVNGNPLAPG